MNVLTAKLEWDNGLFYATIDHIPHTLMNGQYEIKAIYNTLSQNERDRLDRNETVHIRHTERVIKLKSIFFE